MRAVPAVGASAVIMTGAGIAFSVLALFQSELAVPGTGSGWAIAFAFALIPTMIAISFFLAGLPRIGAARSSLLSTWEPVVTVVLAVVLFGDTFSPVQLVGGVLIMVAVVVVQSAHLWRPGQASALKQ